MVERLIFSILFFVFLGCGCAFGSTMPGEKINNIDAKYPPLKTTLPMTNAPVPPAVQPQPVDFGVCSKSFKIDSQKLFYLTLAGAGANRFTINEIQSKSGYVLFSVAQRQFLASVINVDSKNSILKITPCNNIYYFPIGIVQNMFKYIELNINAPVAKLSVS